MTHQVNLYRAVRGGGGCKQIYLKFINCKIFSNVWAWKNYFDNQCTKHFPQRERGEGGGSIALKLRFHLKLPVNNVLTSLICWRFNDLLTFQRCRFASINRNVRDFKCSHVSSHFHLTNILGNIPAFILVRVFCVSYTSSALLWHIWSTGHL